MKHLATISYIMTAMGLVLVAASATTDLSPVWLLSGVLLTLAGVVKIAVVQIWQHVVGL